MKFFIGPMSKNVVDTVIEFSTQHNIDMVFIPSRRQVDYDKGYVNNWNTKEFVQYVRSKNNKILIERDHAGPGQGSVDDDGYSSLSVDALYVDIIHIDPWKKYSDFDEGLKWTIDMITFCYNINPNVEYEIGTEENIRKFEVDELEELIIQLQKKLPADIFKKIKYLVIQCGTKLSEKSNIGSFDSEVLSKMMQLANKYGYIAKEHNGDWVNHDIVNKKQLYGLNCINIAPEFGEIETSVLMTYFKKYGLFDDFYRICYESKKWVKWVNTSFDPERNKEKLVLISGHYTFSYPDFLRLKHILINEHHICIDELIYHAIRNKLEKLYNLK